MIGEFGENVLPVLVDLIARDAFGGEAENDRRIGERRRLIQETAAGHVGDQDRQLGRIQAEVLARNYSEEHFWGRKPYRSRILP